MKKSDVLKMPAYFDRYINLVEDIELLTALKKYGPDFFEKEKEHFEKLGDKVYAPGKWTVKQLLQHIIDAERVFAYRALRFARNDKAELHSFSEEDFAANAKVETKTVASLLAEFRYLRESSILFFTDMDVETLYREGIASGDKISVLALGFTMAGHPVHHMNVIKERYYPLI